LLYSLMIASLCAVPWVLWTWAVTGSPIPATINAKKAWFAEMGLPAGVKTRWVASEVASFLVSFGLVSLIALLLIWRTWIGRVGAAFAVVLVAAYWLNIPGALGHYEQRYQYVLAPILLLGAATGFRLGTPRAHSALAILLLAQALLFAPLRWHEHQQGRAFTVRELEGVASWCRDNLAPGSVLLIHDAGYIAWAAPFRMADLVGLKTPSSIQDHQDLTLPSRGAQRPVAMARIASRSRATHLVVLSTWGAIFQITQGLSSQGWTVDPLRTTGEYRVFRLAPPRE
jgi:hypothetical protein